MRKVFDSETVEVGLNEEITPKLHLKDRGAMIHEVLHTMSHLIWIIPDPCFEKRTMYLF